jgi:hypothetical protein
MGSILNAGIEFDGDWRVSVLNEGGWIRLIVCNEEEQIAMVKKKFEEEVQRRYQYTIYDQVIEFVFLFFFNLCKSLRFFFKKNNDFSLKEKKKDYDFFLC